MNENKEVTAAVIDLLYLVDELSCDRHIVYDKECDCTGESFCGRHCESCGCIKLKVDRARAALAKTGRSA